MAKKSYNEKLIDNSLPKIVDLSNKPDFVAHYKATSMLIASPMEYNDIMAKVPQGKIITMDRVREFLANKHKAGTTCALTAGIFSNIVAHASEERQGVNPVCWWRTLKSGGELNEKFPGGIDNQKMLLEAEGHKIVQKGKRFFVENYEKSLWTIE